MKIYKLEVERYLWTRLLNFKVKRQSDDEISVKISKKTSNDILFNSKINDFSNGRILLI